MTRAEWRGGRIFEIERDRLGDLFARELGEQRQREIDAGGHAAAGHEVVVAHDPRLNRNCAEGLEQVVRRPMGGRALSLQQSGGAEHERAGADRSDEPRPVRLPPHEGDRRLVGHQGVDPNAAGDAQDVKLRAVLEGRIGRKHEAGRRGHGLQSLGDEPHARSGPARKHFVGSGQVELLDVRKRQQADLQRS